MTAYRIIRGVVTSKGPKQAGDIVEGLSDHEVRVYLAQGRIVPHDETEIKSASVEVEHRDPQPAKKRGRPSKGAE